MKKLILIVALFFLLISYGNYRKHQLLSRAQNNQPSRKPKRSRALSYEEMAAKKRADEAESMFQKITLDSTGIDSTAKVTTNTDSTHTDSIYTESLAEITNPKPDSILIDTLEAETVLDSL